MSRRELNKLRKMHARDLVALFDQGNELAMRVLIDKQQSGQALRLYQQPRTDVDDDGVVGVLIAHHKGRISIRSGRPSTELMVDEEVCLTWITQIASAIADAATYFANTYEGELPQKDRITRIMNAVSMKGFEVLVTASTDPSYVLVQFKPDGAKRWLLSVKEGCKLISTLISKATERGWALDSLGSKQLEAVTKLAALSS